MSCKPILIVDDHEGIRSSLQEFFAGEGFPVLLACDGQKALDLLAKKTTPILGLMLVDCRMPVMSGAVFLVELQRIKPRLFAQTPIFMMSAGDGAQQVAVKTTGFLRKPFDLDELLRIAKQYCE